MRFRSAPSTLRSKWRITGLRAAASAGGQAADLVAVFSTGAAKAGARLHAAKTTIAHA
jgi:hypothetical protein